MLDVSGLGLGVYRGSMEKTIGPRQHYIDFGKVGRHPAVLKVAQQRFRGRCVLNARAFCPRHAHIWLCLAVSRNVITGASAAL
jgi:hypothetical protein